MLRFNRAGRLVSVVACSCLVMACGGDDSDEPGGPSGGGSELLTQAPHCPVGTDALRIEGSVDGATVNDQRSTNINAGLTNVGNSTFDTPLVDFAALQPSELEIHIQWAKSLFYGQTDVTSGGTLIAPSGSAHAGQTLCITAGNVGFVDGGSEDGTFKFKVSELRAGADCMGDVVPVELRGCFQ